MSHVTAAQGNFPVWPVLLKYSRDECFQILRRLELEAYSKVVSVFRAQGPLTGAKRKVLYKLQRLLSITTDRHKAEVRRALNDEELITISEAACGREVYEEWISEGKRVAPVLHRPSAKTAYLAEANRAAFNQLCENYSTPPPCETAYLTLTPEGVPTELRPSSPSVEGKQIGKTYSDKSTQTVKLLSGSPSAPLEDCESHEIDNIPRVGYEITCETESLTLPTEMLNGHVKQKLPFVVDSQTTTATGASSVSARASQDTTEGQVDSYTNHQLTSEYESSRVSLSAQLNSAHGTPTSESFPGFSKPADAVLSTFGKPGSVEPSSIASHASRKRSLSTSPNTTEVTNAPSKLLSLVHAPNTLATTARRTTHSQIIQNNPQSESVLNTPAAIQAVPRTQEMVHYSTVQRVQSKSTQGVMGLHSSSGNRAHSQLVLQMCRPASETLSTADSTFSATRSGNTVVIPPRPGQVNTVTRTYTGVQMPGGGLSFKSPLIGPRVQRSGTSAMTDSGADSAQRAYSSTATPSIAMVHSLQGMSGTHRVPAAVTTVVLSTTSSFTSEMSGSSISGPHSTVQTFSSSFKPNTTTTIVGTQNNHVPSTMSNIPASDGGAPSPSPSMATRRLVSSAQPLIVPGLQVSVASNVVQNTISTPGNNNVIVFQRGARKTSGMCHAPIKLAPATPCIIPSTSTPTTPIMTGGLGSRQIRILGLSSTIPSGCLSALTTSSSSAAATAATSTTGVVSVAPQTHTAPDSRNSPPTISDSTPVSLPDLEKMQSDAVSSLLSRASRLGAMLEVDLDAEDYMNQPPPLDPVTTHCVSFQHADPSLAVSATHSSQPGAGESQHLQLELASLGVTGQLPVSESEDVTCASRITATRTTNNPHPTDSVNLPISEMEHNAATEHPPIERDCFDTPIEVQSNKKIDQLKAILGLTTHGASNVESAEEYALTSRSYPSSFDQTASSTSESWMIERPSLSGCLIPEPKRARLSPAVSEVLDLASSPPALSKHHFPLPSSLILIRCIVSCDEGQATVLFMFLHHIVFPVLVLVLCVASSLPLYNIAGKWMAPFAEHANWRSDLEAVLQQLSHASVLFVHVAGCDQPDWTNRGDLLMNEQNLIDPLRALRTWAALVPDLLTDQTEVVTQLLLSVLTQMTNFLDALLLVLYRDGELSSQWTVLKQVEQKHFVLSLPRLLLGSLTDHPLSAQFPLQSSRMGSYAAMLYYSVLLQFESSSLISDTEGLELLARKMILDVVVLQSLVFQCTVPEVEDNTLQTHCQLHYRLLLSKLAVILSGHRWNIDPETDTAVACTRTGQLMPIVVCATGLVMFFRSDDLRPVDTPTGAERCLEAQTIRPCLTFYDLYKRTQKSVASIVNGLIDMFDQECRNWISSLLRLIETDPNEHEVLKSESGGSAFPFAQLRGVVHLLSESVFSESTCQRHSISIPEGIDAEGESAERLWNRICDLLVFWNASSDWLDQIFPSSVEAVHRRSVNGEPCTVYPSRMARTWRTIPSTSPLSLCQAVGFLHDCLRCMTGLISMFPQLSFALASHSLGFQIPDSVLRSNFRPKRTAFQCILDATNRDRLNPLASEWSILLIKLAVKPESTDEKALKGARLLSSELNNLQLFR
ncbi:unnamed protein product [Echinostoma caproni]|uniref:ENT domain-containing protein n=1 Tax=Echinostoma caproni TaxID=27848 RepID=A0A183ACM9_9TREM|nr:unnamed protein product [Echinostoma caproni]